MYCYQVVVVAGNQLVQGGSISAALGQIPRKAAAAAGSAHIDVHFECGEVFRTLKLLYSSTENNDAARTHDCYDKQSSPTQTPDR